MARLVWDNTGDRLFETGVNNVVLYPISAGGAYNKGVAWNGITGITESPSGAEATPIYADNIKYLNLYSAEEFGATVEAYTYPDEFAECDGSAEIATGVAIGQQSRKVFGLCYKTVLGNDTEGNDHGYKLHIIYGCQASPSEKAFATINDSPEAITFSWEVSTTPVPVAGFKNTATVCIDSTKTSAAKMAALEAILYGTNAGTTYVPVTPVGSENPSTEGWYELVAGSYILSEDTTVDEEKTYYEAETTTDVAPRLPLPAEIMSIMA